MIQGVRILFRADEMRWIAIIMMLCWVCTCTAVVKESHTLPLVKTVPTDKGYLVVRHIYYDSTIIGDSIRIEGVIHDAVIGDTSHDGHNLTFMHDMNKVMKPRAFGTSAGYRYTVGRTVRSVSYGMLFNNCLREDCPRLDSLHLPAGIVIVVDAYLRYRRL